MRVPCRVWVGAKVTSHQRSSLVAVQSAERWVVVPASDASGANAFEVERLLIQFRAAQRHRVAVLDDDEDVADSIVDYMNGTGLEAQAFYSLDKILTSAESRPFDGYVIDWLIDQQTARALIATIRATDSACPIVLLTGQLEKGNADESELASVSSFYRLTYFEKPIRTSSLLSALQLGFEVHSSA